VRKIPKIYKTGLSWGVLFAALVNGIYDALISLLHGNFQDVGYFSIATMAVVLIVAIGFRKLLFPEDYEKKRKS
jgi:hypothetical protein